MKTRWARAFAAALLFAATPVHAEDVAPASDAARKQAAQRMKDGRALFDDRRFEDARLAYAQACSIVASFNCIRSLAAAEFKSGHVVEAYDHMTQTMAKPEYAALPADTRTYFESLRAEAQKATAHLAIEGPVGAAVSLDGFVLGALSPADPVTTTTGHHTLTARTSEGPYRAEVDAPGGDVTRVELTPVHEGTARSGAEAPPVVARTPVAPPPTAADVAGIEPPLRPATWWNGPRIAAVSLGIVAVAGVATGAGMLAASHNAAGDAQALRSGLSQGQCALSSPPSCGQLKDKVDAVDRDKTVSIVGFAVGGAAAIAALGVLVFADTGHRVRTGAVTWTPVLAPDGVMLHGSF